MRRKLILLGLVFSVLIASQAATTANASYKRFYLCSTGDGDRIIEVGEKIVWIMTIWIYNDQGSDMTDIVVKDNLAAELQIDCIYSKSKGTVSWYTTGKSEKVHLTWNVGTLKPQKYAWLALCVSTDLNPSGKQEYTSPGEYELNSGATVKYKVNGVNYSFEMPPNMVTVLP